MLVIRTPKEESMLITRFGDAVVPMDEALARCALDLSGRPYTVLDLAFRGERMGALSTQLVEHALESLARTRQVFGMA